MQWLKSTTIIKAYLIAVFVIGMTFSPTIEFVLSIALLIINLYSTYKKLPLKINIALLLGTIILTPLTLTQLTGSILSSLFVLPAIYLLDQNLKEYAVTQSLQPQKRNREPTQIIKTTIIALGVILAASLTLVNVTLITTSVVLIAYFTVILSLAIINTPKNPTQNTKTWSRLLVGNTEKKTIQIHSVAKQSLYVTVTPLQTWTRVKQASYILKSGKKADIEVMFTPPLAGPTKIQLGLSTLDMRGLIQDTQLIEPIELHVLPRAKYAEWLAKKFLEHSGSGAPALAATSPLKALKAARRSVEYYGNRPYQPGDRLREVDWKHTYMLSELTVKEFAGAHGQPVIIVADLTVKNAQDADKLAYKLVMATLTATAEALPLGLVAYNQTEVTVLMIPTDPKETLKKTLKTIGNIVIIDKPLRTIQMVDIHKLEKTIKALGETKTKQAGELAIILEAKWKAVEKINETDSATRTLTKIIKRSSASTIIVVLTSEGYDAKTLQLVRYKLRGTGFNVMTI